MKLSDTPDSHGSRLVSHGKLLQIAPVITDPSGQPYMLPFATWEVDNWLMGFESNHVIPMDYTLWSPQRLVIPGTASTRSCDLSFQARVLENNPEWRPAAGPTMDAEMTRQIVEAIRESRQ